MAEPKIALKADTIASLRSKKKKDGAFKTKEEHITSIAFLLWVNSQIYKQNRMSRISLFERLYNNQMPPKERQLFNVCLPIMGGFEDALKANLTDPVQLRFDPTNPKDYLVTPKLQAQWEAEKDGLAPHQEWNSKARDDMHNAMLSGRGILKFYPENDPEYRSVLEVVNYTNFHCQPLGGKNLENHTFVGEDGIYMTKYEIEHNEAFPKEQREKIRDFSYTDEWWQNIEMEYGTWFARFKSLGLNIESNTFAGTETLFLCQFIITYEDGLRYYVLFDPISQNYLRCEPLYDVIGTDKYPYVSWATHEDSLNFWSKGFSDDIFAIALVISTLFNQELTNREKQNFNARAVDPEMFTDLQKLDEAQYFPDRIVPVETLQGTRKIAEGIYSFSTPELTGTVNLINWMDGYLGKNVGITDLTMGANPGQKGGGQQKAQVVLAQQNQVSKRIGFRAEPQKEAWAKIGERYVEGLREFMPATLPVKIIGESGYTEEAELKRVEMRRSGNIGIKVISTSAEQQENDAKAAKKMKALDMVKDSPNVNPQWRDENILKFGGWDDEDVKMAMDTQTYGSKIQIAQASKAIQDLLKGKHPDIYYGAEIAFMQYIQDFATNNQGKLKGKYNLFFSYLNEVAPYAAKNMARKAQGIKAGRIPPPAGMAAQAGKDGKPAAPATPGAVNKPVAPPAAAPAPQVQ